MSFNKQTRFVYLILALKKILVGFFRVKLPFYTFYVQQFNEINTFSFKFPLKRLKKQEARKKSNTNCSLGRAGL